MDFAVYQPILLITPNLPIVIIPLCIGATTKVVTVLTATDTLSDICKAVPIPVNAIGGLNTNNLDILKGIDISGICVVSAIMKADNPKTAAEKLLEITKTELKI